MQWKMISPRRIEHNDGHIIELESGSWKEPQDIAPQLKGQPQALTAAQLIREGLAFAARAKAPQKATVKLPPKPLNKPKRPVLSLKKK